MDRIALFVCTAVRLPVELIDPLVQDDLQAKCIATAISLKD
jgi:hypothetical protein